MSVAIKFHILIALKFLGQVATYYSVRADCQLSNVYLHFPDFVSMLAYCLSIRLP